MNSLIEPRESPIHGTGVFAIKPIAADTLIDTYRGSPTELDGKHVLWIQSGAGFRGVDGAGVLRFLNHSQTPNTSFDGCELYATRDIDADEELLFDYGDDWSDVS